MDCSRPRDAGRYETGVARSAVDDPDRPAEVSGFSVLPPSVRKLITVGIAGACSAEFNRFTGRCDQFHDVPVGIATKSGNRIVIGSVVRIFDTPVHAGGKIILKCFAPAEHGCI